MNWYFQVKFISLATNCKFSIFSFYRRFLIFNFHFSNEQDKIFKSAFSIYAKITERTWGIISVWIWWCFFGSYAQKVWWAYFKVMKNITYNSN